MILLHRLHDVDSPERLSWLQFRVLQSKLDCISTRVRQSYSSVLGWIGQAARGVSRKLPGSFRSTKHQWNLALCPIFQFLGRWFFHQLHVDHRRMDWRYRIRCDGEGQRSTIHNEGRWSRWEWRQLRKLAYGGGFWYNWCGYAHLTTSTKSTLYGFDWYLTNSSNGHMSLNLVEVRLLC